MNRERLRVIATALLLVCAVPVQAQAQSDSDALIDHGVELRKQGKNAEALSEFQRAFELDPSPRALAQVALAQQALGAWLQAEQGLVQALAARDDPFVRRNLAPLQIALTTVRGHLGDLRIVTDVEGAQLFVDGRRVGVSPLAAAVRATTGTHAVEARAPGCDPVRQSVEITTGTRQRVRLRLATTCPPALRAMPVVVPGSRAAPAQHTIGPSATAAPELPVALPQPTPPQSPGPPSAAHGSGLRTAGVAALVAGGVLLAGGITAHAMREYYASKWNDSAFCDTKQFDCTRYKRAATTAGTLAIVGYAAAGAALATGLVLLLSAPGAAPESHQQLRAGVSAGGAYLEWAAAL